MLLLPIFALEATILSDRPPRHRAWREWDPWGRPVKSRPGSRESLKHFDLEARVCKKRQRDARKQSYRVAG